MELPTYSAVFSFEKRLYAIYDFELPVPVSLFQMGAFVASLLVTVVLAGGVLGIGLTAATACVFVVPPVFAAYLASRPLGDGKRPHQWLASQARFLGEHRTLVRLRPDRGGHRKVRLSAGRLPFRVHLGREWAPQRVRPRGVALVVRSGSTEEVS